MIASRFSLAHNQSWKVAPFIYYGGLVEFIWDLKSQNWREDSHSVVAITVKVGAENIPVKRKHCFGSRIVYSHHMLG